MYLQCNGHESLMQMSVIQTAPITTPEVTLTQTVQSLLLQTLNLSISIPTMAIAMDSKVNLKIASTPILMPTPALRQPALTFREQNRYRMLMQYIETLLAGSEFEMGAIDRFMEVFLRVLQADVDVMQRNEVTRANSFKIKEKLLFRINEITKKTHGLMDTCEQINDKEDIVSFIAIHMKNYLLNMKLIGDEYEEVSRVEILTPLKIDTIYEYENSSEEDYNQHYEPLLEVLVRLRANMSNLYEDVRNCSRIDMPLKSVNLLANCKNLLMELDQFLIRDDCAYNRLIFHVVTQQTENMRLITGFYKHHLDFAKSLVYNVFKCVFLGYIFVEEYNKFTTAIHKQRTKILEHIGKIVPGARPQTLAQTLHSMSGLKSNLARIDSQLKQLQNVICYGKTNIMRQYLEAEISHKLHLVLNLKQQLHNLFILCEGVGQFVQLVRFVEAETVALEGLRAQAGKYGGMLGVGDGSKSKGEGLGERESHDSNGRRESQGLLRSTFVAIQEGYLRVNAQLSTLDRLSRLSRQTKIRQTYLPTLGHSLATLKSNYLQIETTLLNSHRSLLEQTQRRCTEAVITSTKTLQQIQTYLTSQTRHEGSTYASIGGEILNEDENSNAVKYLLGKVDKAQYLSSRYGAEKGQAEWRTLGEGRQFLEWLLVVYEGSADEGILQSVVDRMDFGEDKPDAVAKNLAKVEQLLTEVQKYLRELKKIIKQATGKQSETENQEPNVQLYRNINMKILRICRQRLVLYQLLELLYSQFASIYRQLKSAPHSGLQQTGVTLFDRSVQQWALVCYHSLHRLKIASRQLKEAKLQEKTRNYILDEIVEPFANRLNMHIGYGEEELENLVLRLQAAMQVDKNHRKLVEQWAGVVEGGLLRNQSLEQYRQRVQAKCQELQAMDEQIVKIMDLSKSEFVVLNMDAIKKIAAETLEYFYVAVEMLEAQDWAQLCQGEEFKDPRVRALVDKLRKSFTGAN